MKLSAFVQRTRALGDIKVPDAQIDAVGEQIKQGATLEKLLKHTSNVLTPLVMLGLWRSSKKQSAHEAYLAKVAARRREAQLPAIPDSLLKQTVARHEVVILEHVEELLPKGGAAEHRRRDAVKEAIALWNACLAIVRREAKIKIVLATEDETLRETYVEFIGVTTLAELKSQRWLTLRRGVNAGALELSFTLPMPSLIAQVEARGAELMAIEHAKKPRALLDELILPYLEAAALALKDEEARNVATRTACTNYMNLLCSPKPRATKLASCWLVPGEAEPSVAVAVLDSEGSYIVGREGALIDGPEPATERVVKTVEQLIGGEPVDTMVLPAKSDDELYNALAVAFSRNMGMIRVKPVALGEGIQLGVDSSIPRNIAKALLLGRRVVRPLNYWGQLDPLSIGIVEYQDSLDLERLRESMLEMRTLARAGVQPSQLQKPAATVAPAAKPMFVPPKNLNPMLKTIDDLRLGMELNCEINNVTHFGAFVTIGLGLEGLIHISELSDRYVNDPNKVVKVGQEVKARIISIDRSRRRLSLTMRSEQVNGRPKISLDQPAQQQRKRSPLEDMAPRRKSSGFGGTSSRQGLTGASRAEALSNLEALFKKKD